MLSRSDCAWTLNFCTTLRRMISPVDDMLSLMRLGLLPLVLCFGSFLCACATPQYGCQWWTLLPRWIYFTVYFSLRFWFPWVLFFSQCIFIASFLCCSQQKQHTNRDVEHFHNFRPAGHYGVPGCVRIALGRPITALRSVVRAISSIIFVKRYYTHLVERFRGQLQKSLWRPGPFQMESRKTTSPS